MYFNSLVYFLFLPGVFLLFLVAGERWRWTVLLLASFGFYAALRLPYLLIVFLLVALMTFASGIAIERNPRESQKRALLWGSLAAMLLILSFLRYSPFAIKSLNALLTLFSLSMVFNPGEALVAIGVSYYVFQALSSIC